METNPITLALVVAVISIISNILWFSSGYAAAKLQFQSIKLNDWETVKVILGGPLSILVILIRAFCKATENLFE